VRIDYGICFRVEIEAFGKIDPEYQDTMAPGQNQIEEYVDFVLNAFDAAENDRKLDIIKKEYHIAAWENRLEMYNAYRRTGYPYDMQPPFSHYPVIFQDYSYIPGSM
jgi:hypothetical protein